MSLNDKTFRCNIINLNINLKSSYKFFKRYPSSKENINTFVVSCFREITTFQNDLLKWENQAKKYNYRKRKRDDNNDDDNKEEENNDDEEEMVKKQK